MNDNKKYHVGFAIAALVLALGLLILLSPVIYVNRVPEPAEVLNAETRVPDTCMEHPELTLTERLEQSEELSLFYRTQLNGHGKEIYDSLRECLLSGSSECSLPPDSSTDEITAILELVLYDEPSIFWFSGAGDIITGGNKGEPADTMSFRPKYSQDPDKAISSILPEYQVEALHLVEPNMLESIRDVLIPESQRQCHAIMANIADNTQAAPGEGSDEQNIDSVLGQHKSVCSGYAKTLVFILRLLDYDCAYVHGSVSDGNGVEEHGWVVARIGGELVECDPTWFDSSVPCLYADIWFCQPIGSAQFVRTHAAVL